MTIALRIQLIVNPAAGQDQPVLAVFNRVMAEVGVEWHVSVTHGPGDGERAAQKSLADGVTRFAVFGGDGTVSEVGRALAGTDATLAILPGGTGNVVAQEIGLPVDLESAVRLAASPTPRTRQLDAMVVDGRPFLQRIGVGAEARAILGASREDKDASGWGAYFRQGLAELGAVGAMRFRLVLDDVELELDAVTCVVANCGLLGRGGFHLAEGIDPSDGVLDVLLLERTDLAGLGAVGMSSMGWGGERRRPGDGLGPGPLHWFGVQRAVIDCDPPQPAHGDGDPLPEGQVEVVVHPAFLTVVVGAE